MAQWLRTLFTAAVSEVLKFNSKQPSIMAFDALLWLMIISVVQAYMQIVLIYIRLFKTLIQTKLAQHFLDIQYHLIN